MRLSISAGILPAALTISLAVFALGCPDDGGKAGSSGTTSTTTAASGGSTAAAEDKGEVLATVNGMDVGSTEFEEMASRKQPAAGDSLSLEEKKEVLDRLIEEKLLYKAALAKGLDQDPKVQKVMVNTLLREEVYASVRNSDFNDEELQAYYEAHKDEFVVPEKVQIKRILIKVGDERDDATAKAEAERIRKELSGNTDKFKELAAKHSEDPFRRRGGDVGFVAATGKPGLDDEVVAKAFTQKVGQLSEVFKSSEGYNIILVANKRERVERTFQQMKGSVLRKVKNERLKSLYENYVSNLRTGAKVQVNEDKLALVEVKATRRVGPGLMLNPGGPKAMGGKAIAGPDVGSDK
jgi:parvulin-like peptidyl-prolyl isomerase